MVEFAEPPVPDLYLDFERLPKLIIKDTLWFEHRGETYEDTLRPHIHERSHLEIRAIDGGAIFRDTCVEDFVNTVYLIGLQWPVQTHCLVLLNAPNSTRTSDGSKVVGRRFCDIWWFSHDRHTLYSVMHTMPTLQSRWPPRDDDIYASSPVGVARGVFPLVPRYVCELMPRSLLKDLFVLRSTMNATESEHKLLQYIRVPIAPPVRSVRTVFVHESSSLHGWSLDSEESTVTDSDYEDLWDVSEAEDTYVGLWRWTYCFGISTPLLMRERYREEVPNYLDFTEPIVGLVRMRDMGLDPKMGPFKLLEHCLSIVLDCCPPEWQAEARTGVLICPSSRKILVTAKSCHCLLRAVPMSLRVILGLTHSSGVDFPCKWGVNIASGPGRLVMWTKSDDDAELEVAAPRKYPVKNTRFSRSVRDMVGTRDLQELTWADLKAYEVLVGRVPESPGSKSCEGKKNFEHVATDAEKVERCGSSTPTTSTEESKHADSLSEVIRMANERAKEEKDHRKQIAPRPRAHNATFPKRCSRGMEKTAPASDEVFAKPVKGKSVPKEKDGDAAFLRMRSPALDAARVKETDEDLDELLRGSNERRFPVNIVRAVGRKMKKAILNEKRLESRQRLMELVSQVTRPLKET